MYVNQPWVADNASYYDRPKQKCNDVLCQTSRTLNTKSAGLCESLAP